MENEIWLAIMAMVATATTLTEFFKRLFKVDKAWFNELLSIIVSEGTAFVTWILGNLPTFFTPEWACVLLEGGFLFGAIRWGYKNLAIVKKIFDVVFSLFGPKLGGKWYEKPKELIADGTFLEAVKSYVTLSNGKDKVGDIQTIANNLLKLAQEKIEKK